MRGEVDLVLFRCLAQFVSWLLPVCIRWGRFLASSPKALNLDIFCRTAPKPLVTKFGTTGQVQPPIQSPRRFQRRGAPLWGARHQ
eukprot:SAG11_NODE_10885_length_799_cov_1.274286_1_plen_84_part_10